jgi:hypothetical protein
VLGTYGSVVTVGGGSAGCGRVAPSESDRKGCENGEEVGGAGRPYAIKTGVVGAEGPGRGAGTGPMIDAEPGW